MEIHLRLRRKRCVLFVGHISIIGGGIRVKKYPPGVALAQRGEGLNEEAGTVHQSYTSGDGAARRKTYNCIQGPALEQA